MTLALHRNCQLPNLIESSPKSKIVIGLTLILSICGPTPPLTQTHSNNCTLQNIPPRLYGNVEDVRDVHLVAPVSLPAQLELAPEGGDEPLEGVADEGEAEGGVE